MSDQKWKTTRGLDRLALCLLLPVLLVANVGRRASAAKAAPKKVFRAGAFAIDVTPKHLPVIVNGSFRERLVSTVTDPLHARCLVLDDGSGEIAFAVVDNCVIPQSLMDQAKRLVREATGIPAERILISATHAHSAPSVCGVLGSGQNEDYMEYLPGRIAAGIEAARKNMVPARIGWAVGKDPTNVFCRRFVMKPGTAATCPFTGSENDQAQMNPGYQNPNAVRRTGPADPDVSILSVQTVDGQPIAILGNYSTHYAGAPGLSADYFGVFARRMGALVGGADVSPPLVGMMTNGTSGDANCCDFVNPRRQFTYVTVGNDVARAGFDAYQRIEYFDWVPLVMEESRITLAVRMPDAEEVAQAKLAFPEMDQRPPADLPEVYARETVLLGQMPATREIKLQAIRIGKLGISAIPCEVYGSTGLKLKSQSPLKPTFTIELANGYAGYLPPPDQFPLGGYTTWRARSSLLEVEAERKITAEVLQLLENVARRRSDEASVPSESRRK